MSSLYKNLYHFSLVDSFFYEELLVLGAPPSFLLIGLLDFFCFDDNFQYNFKLLTTVLHSTIHCFITLKQYLIILSSFFLDSLLIVAVFFFLFGLFIFQITGTFSDMNIHNKFESLELCYLKNLQIKVHSPNIPTNGKTSIIKQTLRL